MRYVCFRRIPNYGNQAYEAGDFIEELPGTNQRSWRFMIDLGWIRPVEGNDEKVQRSRTKAVET